MPFQTEFPDYPATDMPAIPAGFEDSSWHNNSAPSFENTALGLSIWIDYAAPEMREYTGSDGKRFIVHDIHSDGSFKSDDASLMTDEWQAVLAFIVAKVEAMGKTALPIQSFPDGAERNGKDDWGSERQIDAQNEFGNAAASLMTEEQRTAFDSYCLKATTEEMISEAMRVIRANLGV